MRNATTDWRRNWVYQVSGAAVLIAGILLLIGMLSLLISALRSGGIGGSPSTFEGNWLIVIFKLHAGLRGAEMGMLQGVHFLDIAILVLVAITHLGLYAALRRSSRIWSVVAAIQPFLGIVLFVATKSAGRSAAMGAGLVASLLMLRSDIFRKTTAYLGIAASALLLVGDFTAGMPPSGLMAAFFAVAYVLLIAWFFQIGQRLLKIGWTRHRAPDSTGLE